MPGCHLPSRLISGETLPTPAPHFILQLCWSALSGVTCPPPGPCTPFRSHILTRASLIPHSSSLTTGLSGYQGPGSPPPQPSLHPLATVSPFPPPCQRGPLCAASLCPHLEQSLAYRGHLRPGRGRCRTSGINTETRFKHVRFWEVTGQCDLQLLPQFKEGGSCAHPPACARECELESYPEEAALRAAGRCQCKHLRRLPVPQA